MLGRQPVASISNCKGGYRTVHNEILNAYLPRLLQDIKLDNKCVRDLHSGGNSL